MNRQLLLEGLRQSYAGQSILITGASGFLGRHVCALLTDLGSKVFAGIHRTPLEVSPKNISVALDLASKESIQTALEMSRPSYILHLAACLNRANDSAAEAENQAINEEGTANLLSAITALPAAQRPVNLVVASTADVYGPSDEPCREEQSLNPANSYGRSKIRAWQLALESGLPCVEARIFMLYGPGQSPKSFVGDLVEAVTTGREFKMSPGDQTRDFIWVRDAAEAILHLGRTASLNQQSVNLCTGREHSLKDSVRLTETILGREIAKNIGAYPYRPHECFRLVGDPGKLNASGYICESTLEDGLAQLLGNLRIRE